MQSIGVLLEGFAGIERFCDLRYLLPLLFLLGSSAAVLIFRCRFWVAAVVASLPVFVVLVKHPYSYLLKGYDPDHLILAGWLLIFGAACGFLLLRYTLRFLNPVSAKAAPFFSFAALFVIIAIAVLFYRPQLIVDSLADRQRALSLSLVGITLTAAVMSVLKGLRLILTTGFWALLCLLLIGQIYYDALPAETLDYSRQQLSNLLKK